MYDCAVSVQPWDKEANIEELIAQFNDDQDCCLAGEEFEKVIEALGGLLDPNTISKECPVTTRGWRIEDVFRLADIDGSGCVDEFEGAWYYECGKVEHSWPDNYDAFYLDNNFDQDLPECMNYNEFEWLINTAGGIKAPEKCKIIPKNKQPIEGDCTAATSIDQIFRKFDKDGDKCMDFYEYKKLFECSADKNRWKLKKEMWEWIKQFDKNGEPDCCLDRGETENSIKALGWFR